MNKETIIQFDHSKRIRNAILAFLATVLGVAIILQPHWFIRSDNTGTITLLGYIFAIVFGLVTLGYGLRIFNRKPAMVIDTEGITDNTAGVAYYKVLWKDVQAIDLLELYQQYFISIKVKNPPYYFQKEKNPLKLRLMEMNNKLYQTPIHLATHHVSMDAAALHQLLQDYYLNYKGRGTNQ